MHFLQNGSQDTNRPPKKPLSGLPGWFTESGENNVPSYPGADWFNHVIAEFQNMLASQGIEFDPENDDHLQKAFEFVNQSLTNHVDNKVNAHDSGAITNVTRTFETIAEMVSNPSDISYSLGQALKVQGESDVVVNYIVVDYASDVQLSPSLWAKKQSLYNTFETCADLQDSVIRGGSFSIGLYGDSTMWGSIPGDSLNQFANHPGVILQNVLYALYPSANIQVSNNAIPGSNLKAMIDGTGQYPQPFDDVMSSSNDKLIYCNHAHNDFFSGNSSLPEYKEYLIEFVKIVRKYGKIPVLCTPNITNYVSDSNFVAAYAKNYSAWVDVMKRVAHDMSVDLVDQYYYTGKTARSVGRKEVVPDGGHPSEKMIRYIGGNMAIPLCQPIRLDEPGDGDGLTGSSYYDDVTNTRWLRVSDENKYGVILSGMSDDSNQRINVPILLDNPTDDTFVAISCLKYSGAGVSKLLHNNTFQEDFGGDVDFSHPAADYNGFVVNKNDLWAGLSIIGLFQNTTVDSRAAGFSISGVELMQRDVPLIAKARVQQFPLDDVTRPILTGDTLTWNVYLDHTATDDSFIKLAYISTGDVWLEMKNKLGVINLYVNGVVTEMGSTVSSGWFEVLLRLDGLGSVTYQLGGFSGATPVTNNIIPDSYLVPVNSFNQSYNLSRRI
ncbi:SGNH/GDSL hydrolase family protein [Vibrio splendidus]|uniref:SGNH/GDSL hydrolase family protein n=1 Tax=Vibrio splendidus TaxID=29497 RepID=UPI00352CF17A